jgi:hypothetical protein
MFDTKNMSVWPVYVSVMSQLPKTVSRQCLISPDHLSKIGIKIPDLYEGSLLWLARLFEEYGGAHSAIQFWQVVVQSASPFSAHAIVRQAIIEANQVSSSNAVERLRRNASAVCQSAWARDRALETLKDIGTQDALATLSAYQVHP